MIGVTTPIPGIIYPPEDRLKAYVESGELPLTTLAEALLESFGKHAGNPALHAAQGSISYGELDSITNRLAAGLLDLGLEPLDRVLFQSENCLELVYALVACIKAGLIPVCTLPAHREREIGYLGRHTDARAHIVFGSSGKFDFEAFALKMQHEIPTIHHVICLTGEAGEGAVSLQQLIDNQPPEKARAVVKAVPRDPFQAAIFQLSGGTTGIPKVIPRMQNGYLLNATLTRDTLNFLPEDVMMMPMPIMHNACMICCLLPCLLAGASFVIPSDRRPEDWAEVISRSNPTFMFLIKPLLPIYEATLELIPDAINHVRAFWSPDSARVLRAKYRKPAYAMFGMSEGLCMYCRPGDSDEAMDWTVGRPLSRFDEVKIVEPGTGNEVADGEMGEMICRGPYTLNGYYNSPARNEIAFTSERFYKPGDLMVRRKIEGKYYYAFAGRTKDVVDRGAEKINCEEVEYAVSTHDAVSACAVIGMPDPRLGERVCAYIVLRGGCSAPDVPVMQQHLEKQGFAKFKWPERIEVIESLPVTKVGKLDKSALREDIASKLKQETAGGPTMDVKLSLNGVHHTARPTWKLKETIEFYRDKLGLKLVHCVSARGWGPSAHPDFLHFFFESGPLGTIAFFYYLGDDQPDHLVHRPEYDSDATHTAWRVESKEELQAWRKRLEDNGVEVMYQIEHEVVESIYFRDPNGYYLEIGRPLREFVPLDQADSAATLEAALMVEEQKAARHERLEDIESVWNAKGRELNIKFKSTAPVCVFVPDFPEFKPLLEGAANSEGCSVLEPVEGYWRIEAERQLHLNRKAIRLGPALWNSALAGGFIGAIQEYGRDDMVITGEGE